ncbi:DUF6906 family protein [Clostridium cadaveris]|uniref:DUF6906 family protein n=1 Tax=Clostridium cadaveris TaxID=1529 RepID=UPI003C2E8221
MKHFRILKRRHKIFLSSQGFNPNNFWIEREGSDFYRFIEKGTKKVLEIRR